jgi:hypothetical protein
MTKSELIEALKDYADDAIIYVSVEIEDWAHDSSGSWITTSIDTVEAQNVSAYAHWTSRPGTIGVKID